MDQNENKDIFDDIKMIERVCQVHDLEDSKKNKRLYKYLKSQRLFNTWVGKSFLEALGRQGKDSSRRRTIERCCRLIAGSFLAMAVVLGVSILYFQIEEEKQEAVLAYIREERRQAELQETQSTEDNSQIEEEPVAILEEYAILYSMNPDLVGWIKIDGTKIDYPVMQSKDNEDYYLSHNFQRESDSKGALFIDAESSIMPKDQNLVIFGHNRRDNSILGTLDYYLDKEFYEKYPTLEFDTLYEKGNYEIVAVVKTAVKQQEESGFRYYWFHNYEEESEFQKFLDFIEENQIYDTGKDLVYGDTTIMLSTCEYTVDNGRLVVIARKM